MKKKTSDRKIAFCFKLWVEELRQSTRSNSIQFVIDMADNEILDGSYCSDKEYLDYLKSGKIRPHRFQ